MSDQPDDTTPPEAPQPIRDARGRLMKGSPRPPNAGCKLGSPHNKMVWDVRALCEAAGFNPVEAMITLAQEAKSEKIRMQAASELTKYIAPQLKSVEHRVEQAQQVVFTWASSPAEVPTINSDGSPVIEHRSEVTIPAGRVLDEIENLLDKD